MGCLRDRQELCHNTKRNTARKSHFANRIVALTSRDKNRLKAIVAPFLAALRLGEHELELLYREREPQCGPLRLLGKNAVEVDVERLAYFIDSSALGIGVDGVFIEEPKKSAFKLEFSVEQLQMILEEAKRRERENGEGLTPALAATC